MMDDKRLEELIEEIYREVSPEDWEAMPVNICDLVNDPIGDYEKEEQR